MENDQFKTLLRLAAESHTRAAQIYREGAEASKLYGDLARDSGDDVQAGKYYLKAIEELNEATAATVKSDELQAEIERMEAEERAEWRATEHRGVGEGDGGHRC